MNVSGLEEPRYVMFAHLKEGSVEVEVGQVVSRGQVLGHLGNTGNSGAPHLHMHLSICANAITCMDRPYVFDEYKLLQQIHYHPLDLPGGKYLGKAQYQPTIQNSLPSNFEVVQFGSTDPIDPYPVCCTCGVSTLGPVLGSTALVLVVLVVIGL